MYYYQVLPYEIIAESCKIDLAFNSLLTAQNDSGCARSKKLADPFIHERQLAFY